MGVEMSIHQNRLPKTPTSISVYKWPSTAINQTMLQTIKIPPKRAMSKLFSFFISYADLFSFGKILNTVNFDVTYSCFLLKAHFDRR